MTLLRGLVGVLVGLAVSVGFVQFLELMLANALAGRALQSMDDYALVLNTLPMLGIVQNGPQIAAYRYTYHAAAPGPRPT